MNETWAIKKAESKSHSVMSDSLPPHGLHSPWNCPGQNTGVGSLSLLQGIFPIQGSNRGLPHCRQILYQLSHQGSPEKGDGWRTNALELWCWRRLLRVPWTSRRSNQSILKKIRPECSLEGLKLKLQYFGHLMWGANALEKTSGKIWRLDKKGATEDKVVGRHHQLNGHQFEQPLGDSEGQGSLACYSPWGPKAQDTTAWRNKTYNMADSHSCLA